MTAPSTDRLTTDEILRLNREYTFFSWSAQAKINPIVIDRAEGIHFWDPDGKRYIDFNSQLMSINIGHGDKRVADAIAEQAHKLAFAPPQGRSASPATRDAGPTSRASRGSSACSTRGAGRAARPSRSRSTSPTSKR